MNTDKLLQLMRRLLIVAIFVMSSQTVLAQRDRDTYTPNSQSFEVSGEVRLSESGSRSANIPVRLERFSGGLIDQIVTDNRGRFRFPNLQRGYYKVVVNAPGYRPMQQDADLQVLARVFLVFELTGDTSKNSTGMPLLVDVVDARVPASAREAFGNGRAALAKKSYKEAIGFLQQAIAGYTNFFEAELLLGIAFMDLREWDSAETAMQRAQSTPTMAPRRFIGGKFTGDKSVIVRLNKRYLMG